MSPDKSHSVLQAAQALFLRHGFKRITMGEIAAAAGLSRPALYLLYANKEAVFNAVLERFVDAQLSEIEHGIGGPPSVAAKLKFALDIWTVRPYELVNQSPEARELTECSYGFASALMARAYTRFEAIVAAVLAPAVAARGRGALDAERLARVFALAVQGIKAGASDVAHLRTLLADLITLTTTALDDTAVPTLKRKRQGSRP